MFGRYAAGLIVIGLAVGVWIIWPDPEPVATTTTLAAATPTTTASTTQLTTTTNATTTTTLVEVVDSAAEAEALLRELWFGWFEGIYDQDVDRIKEVVASQNQLDAAIAAFGVMTFESPPTRDGIVLSDIEILRADAGCTAIWVQVQVSGFREAEFFGVHVFRYLDRSWMFVAIWEFTNDLWEGDCEALVG
jgi:hypothetical protein